MKLNKLLASLLIIFFLIISTVPVSAVQENSIGTSKNTIYFLEDYNPWNNGNPDPKPSANGKSESDKPVGFFPQTGEVKTIVFSTIGFIILLLVGVTIYLKSKNIKKEKLKESL